MLSAVNVLAGDGASSAPAMQQEQPLVGTGEPYGVPQSPYRLEAEVQSRPSTHLTNPRPSVIEYYAFSTQGAPWR